MSKTDLAKKLLKKSTNPYSYLISEEDRMAVRDYVDTGNVALNCQVSGDPYKGLASGRIYQFAGPESTGKTYLTIEAIIRFQKAGYTIWYYDTEGAQNKTELLKRGIDPELLVHSPINLIKSLQTDLLNLLDEVDNDDKLCVVIDSMGMLGSLKEIADAIDARDKVDMTRSKELKSLFRTITVPCALKQVPIIAVNHTYDDISSPYGGKIVGGGGGPKYASSVTLSLTKSQHKEDTEVVGSFATSTAIKNRLAREKSKIKIEINYHTGLNRWSGLFDIALETEFIKQVTKQSYCIQNNEDQTFKRKAVELDDDFWLELLDNGFDDALRLHFAYQSHTGTILEDLGIDSNEEVDVSGEID